MLVKKFLGSIHEKIIGSIYRDRSIVSLCAFVVTVSPLFSYSDHMKGNGFYYPQVPKKLVCSVYTYNSFLQGNTL